MSRQRPILGWIALLVGALATLRVVLFAFLDRSPRFGGSEANELKLLVFYHRPFRASIEGHRFVDFGALRSMIEAEAHQPPLWYVGVPALFAGSESLSYGPLLLTNAAALALALWAAWQFGTRQGRPLLGLLGVVVLSSLPLVAGRVTLLGVEPWHMALLGLTLGLFLRVREGDATRRHAVLLGVVVAAGLLMKLTFLAALLGPLLLECSAALRGGRAAKQWRLRLLEAAAVALVLGLVCFLPFTGPGKIAAAAGVEPSHESVLSLESLLFLPGLFWEEMGLGECVLLAMALLGAWLSRGGEGGAPHLGCRPTTLLLASVLSLFAIHALVPHKEVRYLLPAAWAVSLLLGVGLEALCVRGPWQRAAVAVTLLLLLAGLIPQYDTTPPDYEHLRFHLDPSDHGIEALVCHESLRGPAGARVLTFLEGPRESFLRDMIEWEAYGRNEHPVVPLGSLTSLLGEAAEQRLGEASHLITNRRLEPAEREQLERLGFVELEVVELLFSRPPTWSLWGPPSVQDPSEQGPSEQGPSVQGPSAQGSSAGPCPAGMVSLLGGTFALGEGSSLPEL